jgi:uncharacterized protein (TIGR03083 family)
VTNASGATDDVPQPEHVSFLFDPRITLRALAGQRKRFAATAATFTDEELASPSRCDGWTVADVLRHLVWVDTTMRQIWSGDESAVTAFDPRTTPNVWVQADRAVPDQEIRQRYLSSSETMIHELESADSSRFGDPSLSPLGRVPWWMSAVHCGWDSTIHERDALMPLGHVIDPASDETTPCLAYSLVLASLFCGRDFLSVQIGPVHVNRDGSLVTASAAGQHPETRIGAQPSLEGLTVLSGSPVQTIDALSGRGLLSSALSGDEIIIDRLGGLARYFLSI